MHSLPIFVDLNGRPVILVGSGDVADAKRRLLERAGARIVDAEAAAALAIVVADSDLEAEAIVGQLRARGVLVNAVDRPALCDFTLPAIVDRDPVLIAIGTGGRSAGLAKELRQRLETLLPTSLGKLADGLFAARDRIRARWPTADGRRHAIDAALGAGGIADPLHPDVDARIEAWLSGDAAQSADRLVPIRLRSADPDDLSLGEARLLGQADTLYHRDSVPAAILDRARADATRVCTAAPPETPAPGLSIDLDYL